MNPERFRDSTAGQVIRAGQGETAYWAFVPHPLPPNISPDWELTRSLSEADRALSQLAGLGRTMPNPHLLIGPFVRREAVLSSRIEGTQADITDLYAYEAGQLPLPGMEMPPPESDVREVLNYIHALEYGLERLNTLPVSLRLILSLLLIEWTLLPLPLLYLSAYFHRHRQDYYDLFRQSDHHYPANAAPAECHLSQRAKQRGEIGQRRHSTAGG